MVFQRFIGAIGSLAIIFLLISHTVHASSTPSTTPTADKPMQLEVYKSPTCGCCEEWISHLQSHGLKSNIHHPDDLNAVKNRYKISPKYQSCHTAVSPDGYVFEGHIPAPVITRFLAEKPEGAIGLAVPGMPVGSPGMEMGERFTPYDVLLLKSDGSSEVYIRITSLTQTF
ncbi:MAG: metal-binding protein [Cellvibrio sp. 79]|nr:MAG: metal-binding protein [Cellvibrio sp. 79]